MSRLEIVDTPAGPARLKRSRRRTLAISVLPDGRLELVAPDQASLEAIVARVAKRMSWIKTQRRAFGEMNALRPALRFVNGATHRFGIPGIESRAGPPMSVDRWSIGVAENHRARRSELRPDGLTSSLS